MKDRANLEIKARVDDLARLELLASELGAELLGVDDQTDVYFNTQRGRLKIRHSSLSGSYLVPYLRDDETGPRESVYDLISLDNPLKAEALLRELLGERVRVIKRRTIYLLDNVRIHLDEVDGLGRFLELEAVVDRAETSAESQRARVESLIGSFGIVDGDLISESYSDLLGAAGRGLSQ